MGLKVEAENVKLVFAKETLNNCRSVRMKPALLGQIGPLAANLAKVSAIHVDNLCILRRIILAERVNMQKLIHA